MAVNKNKDESLEMSEEDYDKLLTDLENFENKFYSTLAESDNYEIVPTSTDEGNYLSREQLTLLTRECHRLGLKYLYKVDISSTVTIFINPQTMKIGYISEGLH